MRMFSSCILLPGDIVGVIVPKIMHYIFETKTGIEKPHPFTIYLTNEGHLLIGFTEDKMKKPLIPLDMLLESFKINNRMGIKMGESE